MAFATLSMPAFFFQRGGTVDERFDLKDTRADLLALKQRLEQSKLGEKIRREPSLPPRDSSGRRKPWHKISAFLSSLSRLPQTRRRVLALEAELANLRDAVISERDAIISEVESELSAIGRDIAAVVTAVDQAAIDAARNIDEQIAEIKHLIQFERLIRQKAFTEFDRRLTLKTKLSGSSLKQNEASSETEPTTSVQSLLESFYFLLEERYRGTREEIKQRLYVYRNDLRAARDRAGVAGPVIDIGCGRGELLEVLVEDGFQAVGVDSNDTQLEAARRHGCAVIHGDAFDYLQSLEANSVLAVTGIHIVEHIPFPDLVRLMQEVIRVLRKGGVAIFETPNPRNIIVGATNFHLDPTHIRPLPPEVLQILLETVGFAGVETRPLHPSDTLDYMVKQHQLDRHVATLLFGPQDYAAIGVMEP